MIIHYSFLVQLTNNVASKPVVEDALYQIETCESISVCFRRELAGGGNEFGRDIVPFVRTHIGRISRVFEWCAGPAFIGFSLLGNGLCDSLCLADINEEAIKACEATIHRNGLQDKVTLYRSDGLRDIAPREKWNLVIGNPPFSGSHALIPDWGRPIKYQDPHWRIHREFYGSVRRFLKPDAAVIIIEHSDYSGPEDFEEMIRDGGLEQKYVMPCGDPLYSSIYYIWSELVHHV